MKRLAHILIPLVAGCSSAPPEPASITHGSAAHTAWQRGMIAAAEHNYELALAEDRFIADIPSAVRHSNNLGVLALYSGEYDTAKASLTQAQELTSLLSHGPEQARLSLQIAALHLRNGETQSAETILANIADWARSADRADRCQHRLLLASLALRRGEHANAAALAADALDDAISGDANAAARVIIGKAATTDPGSARAAFMQGLDHARSAGHLPLIVECLLGIAHSYASTDSAAARLYGQLALDAATARGFAPGIARANAALERLR